MSIANASSENSSRRNGSISLLAVLRSIGLAAAIVMSCAPVGAEELEFGFPAGWKVFPLSPPMSQTPDVFAIALKSATSPADSRVVQYRISSSGLPTTVTTDLTPGIVTSVEVSPDGSRVLVHQAPTNLPEHTFRIWMIDANGTVQWYRDESKHYRFSTTGQVLSAIGPVGDMGFGSQFGIYNLDGSLRRTVQLVEPPPFADRPNPVLHDVLLLGAGNRVIAASTRFLWSASTLAPSTIYWRLSGGSRRSGEVMGIRRFDAATIGTQETGRGQFRIVDANSGTIRYLFDPVLLSANDENREAGRTRWAGYEAFPGATPGRVVLFDRTSLAYALDLASGALTPFAVDVTAPLNASVGEDYSFERMVLVSPTGVRLRLRVQAE